MEEQKKKKKFPWGTVIYMLVCVAVGAVFGLALAVAEVEVTGLVSVGMMAAFLGAFFLHIIIHEAGHMLFGMLTGYKFLSYRVFSLMWEKAPDGKVRFSRYSLAGTLGQCLLSPPDYNEGDYPYVWYNLGGVLANLALSLLAAAGLILLPKTAAGIIICFATLLTGLFTAFFNGVPMSGKNMQVNNDGSNIVAIGKSQAARRAFWMQMKANEQIAWGKRLKELPEEYFTGYPQEEKANAMVISMDVLAALRQLDAMSFDRAEEMMLSLVENQHVPGIYRQQLTFELAWIELISGRPGKMVQRLEEKTMKQFAQAMKTFPTVLRTRYALALLQDKDNAKAEKVLEEFEKMAAQYPHPSEIAGERELMELTARRTQEV